MLKCPDCLTRKNWYMGDFTQEEDEEVALWRLQAAYRLRASHMKLKFYADRAKKERALSGTEMPYWLSLQGSQMTLERRSPDPESIQGLTKEDLPDSLPFLWLMQVEKILLSQRQSTLVCERDSGTA